MYSANDWRNYTLLHAMSNLDRESKWEWPGGNNSKAYNEWYYSYHKDKWRQYYLNKKKKQKSLTPAEEEFVRNARVKYRAKNILDDVDRNTGWTDYNDHSITGTTDHQIRRQASGFRKMAEEENKRDVRRWGKNAYTAAREAVEGLKGPKNSPTYNPDYYERYKAEMRRRRNSVSRTPSQGMSVNRQTR